MADVSKSSSNRPAYRNWLNPSLLAGVISVGFHGVLFAAGPSFPNLGFNGLVEPELEAERRNVPLVELSEAEQARLPDFSGRSPFDFDTFDDSFNDFESLPPLFSSDDLQMDDGSDSAIAGSAPSPLTRRRSVPTPSYRIPFGITSLEPRQRSVPLPSRSQPSGNAALPKPGEGGETPPNPPANGTENTPDDGTAADLAPLPNRDGEAPRSSADIARGSNPTEVMSLEERLQAYTYDAADTDPEAAQERFTEWLTVGSGFAEELAISEEEFAIAAENALKAPEEDAEVTPAADAAEEDDATTSPDDATAAENQLIRAPIELPIDHEQRICLAKEPQKGLIGAWVSPAGELLGEPEIIRSTGYTGLNQQAIQRIRTLDFSSVDRFTGYQFEVIVNYNPENCVNFGQAAPAPNEEVARDRENADAADKTPPKEDSPAERRPLPADADPRRERATPNDADSSDSSEPAAGESSANEDNPGD